MATSNQVFGTTGADVPLNGTASDDKLYGYGGADSIYGGEGSDSLYAGAGNDTLYGGEGNDFLDGGTGSDAMYGGAGNDVYVIDTAGDTLSEAINEGIDEVRTSISYTLGANFENLRLTVGGLTGNGNELNNGLVGSAGNDILDGKGGNDSISGNAGNDQIYGGAGNDWMSGGDGDDTLIGSTGSDSFYGGAGNDVMNVEIAELKNVYGGDGWDRVNLDIVGAVAGVKVDMAARGIEQINGTNLADVIDGSGITTAAAWGTFAQIYGGGGDDIITGSAFADYLEGNGGNDTIYAGAGGDAMLGGDGDDILVGGAQQDHFTGGAGADTFVFGVGDAPGGANYLGDRIHSFVQGEDVFDFSALGITFANLTFSSAGGHTYVAINWDGSPGTDGWLDLDTSVTLTAADFIFGP